MSVFNPKLMVLDGMLTQLFMSDATRFARAWEVAADLLSSAGETDLVSRYPKPSGQDAFFQTTLGVELLSSNSLKARQVISSRLDDFVREASLESDAMRWRQLLMLAEERYGPGWFEPIPLHALKDRQELPFPYVMEKYYRHRNPNSVLEVGIESPEAMRIRLVLPLVEYLLHNFGTNARILICSSDKGVSDLIANIALRPQGLLKIGCWSESRRKARQITVVSELTDVYSLARSMGGEILGIVVLDAEMSKQPEWSRLSALSKRLAFVMGSKENLSEYALQVQIDQVPTVTQPSPPASEPAQTEEPDPPTLRSSVPPPQEEKPAAVSQPEPPSPPKPSQVPAPSNPKPAPIPMPPKPSPVVTSSTTKPAAPSPGTRLREFVIPGAFRFADYKDSLPRQEDLPAKEEPLIFPRPLVKSAGPLELHLRFVHGALTAVLFRINAELIAAYQATKNAEERTRYRSWARERLVEEVKPYYLAALPRAYEPYPSLRELLFDHTWPANIADWYRLLHLSE